MMRLIQSSLTSYINREPSLDLRQFYNGEIKAHGIVQNWRGRVTRTFKLTMHCHWQGNIGTFAEFFHYSDGVKSQRKWQIEMLDGGQYRGVAADVIGYANGMQLGNAAHSIYTVKLPVSGKTHKIKFDDWMFLVDDNHIINIIDMKKFGLTVAKVVIHIEKQQSIE